MTLRFQYFAFDWTIREGGPPMGSHERSSPLFVDALKTAHRPLSKLTDHELASWVVARLSYLTSGALPLEGDEFSHDTNEFGYKLKITDQKKVSVAHGAIVIHSCSPDILRIC